MRHALLATAAVAAALLVLPSRAPAAPRPLDPATKFSVPPPSSVAVRQVASLFLSGRIVDAIKVGSMLAQGHAVWFTGGTPAQVEKDVRTTMQLAALQRRTPVLVAYFVPYRDCGQFSAGGATSTAEYLAWIDAFAKGIGSGKALVVLEPDGLGIIPYNVDLQGVHEWCQPPGGSAALVDERYTQLNGAVDRLEQQPNASVYLDATHTNWLGSGEAAYRLVQAGVLRAQGFFLNVSNYQPTPQLVQYGTWIATCIWFATNPGSWGVGHFDWCGSQYYPASPHDYSTWGLTDQWYRDNVESQTWVPYPGDAGLTHFVVDTSRNGQGPWTPTVSYPDAQDWCNPPRRGVGVRPTAATGNTLVDAFLWVKVPGESDGSCNRGIAGSTTDPEWGGIVDPPAGAWFPQQALELARLASPSLP
jgi:endoglucanase